MEQKKKKRSAGKLRMILAVLLLAGMIFPALFAEQETWSGEGGRAEAEEVLEETGLDSGEKAAGGSEDLRETENEPAKDTEKPAAQTEAFQSETVKEEMPEETLQESTEVSEEDGKDIQESEKMSEDKTAGTETGTEAGASKEETSGTEAQTAAISFGNRQSEGSTALSETAASGKTETKKRSARLFGERGGTGLGARNRRLDRVGIRDGVRIRDRVRLRNRGQNQGRSQNPRQSQTPEQNRRQKKTCLFFWMNSGEMDLYGRWAAFSIYGQVSHRVQGQFRDSLLPWAFPAILSM